MILLRPDCLVFKTAAGEQVPCSAHEVSVELIGDSAKSVDKDLILNAAAGVLHYFKVEKGQDTVSVGEFSEALDRALRGLGLDVKLAGASIELELSKPPGPPRIIEADLNRLATESANAWELCFFPRLRDEVRRQLDGSPLVLRFRGLRPCVKLLAGSKRWTAHCQSLNDQIVDYLRTCLGSEKSGNGCALVVLQ